MSGQRPEEDSASRWRREASEELRAAEVVAAHDEVPDRVAGFHAHLAAEKALKSLLIELGIEVPRIHDLIGLHRLLPVADQTRFDPADLDTLNPWSIEGRYPADLPDVASAVLDETIAAARRVLEAVSGQNT